MDFLKKAYSPQVLSAARMDNQDVQIDRTSMSGVDCSCSRAPGKYNVMKRIIVIDYPRWLNHGVLDNSVLGRHQPRTPYTTS